MYPSVPLLLWCFYSFFISTGTYHEQHLCIFIFIYCKKNCITIISNDKNLNKLQINKKANDNKLNK